MQKPAIILTGSISGQWYIQTLNQLFKEIHGTDKTFNYITLQTDFNKINPLLPYRLKEAAKLLEPYFIEIEKRTQHPYILANITLHETLKYFTTKPNNFISLKEILNKEKNKLNGKIGILGTAYTMQNQYIPSLVPNSEIIDLPNEIVQQVDELRKAYFYKKDAALANKVLKNLEPFDADYWIIACTELSVAFLDSHFDENKVINLPKLQCKALLESLK